MPDLSDWIVTSWSRGRRCRLRLFALLSALALLSTVSEALFTRAPEAADGASDLVPFVAGGARIDVARHPYLLSLRDPGSSEHKCAAFLISPAVALTAAHCFDDYPDLVPHLAKPCPPGNLLCQLTGGEHFESVEVDYTVQHEGWTRDWKEGYDLAIIVLKEPLVGHPTLAILPQPPPTVFEDKKALFVMGWGIVSNEDESSEAEMSDTLQGVVVLYHSVESCQQKYVDANKGRVITPEMICAGQDGKGACQGDSGGPLIIMGGSWDEDLAVGIVSFGSRKCGQKDGVPGVFTRLGSYAVDLEYALSIGPLPKAPEPAPVPPPPTTEAIEHQELLSSAPLPGGPRAAHTFTGLSDCPRVFVSVVAELIDMSFLSKRENLRVRLSGGAGGPRQPPAWSDCRHNNQVIGDSCRRWAFVMCGKDASALAKSGRGELTVEVLGSEFITEPCDDGEALNAVVTVECAPASAMVCSGGNGLGALLGTTKSAHCRDEASRWPSPPRPDNSPPPPSPSPPSPPPPPGPGIDIARHPYLLSLRDPGSSEHVCTAFLVSPAVAVTAAHCFDYAPDLVLHLVKPCSPGNHLCQQTGGDRLIVEVDNTIKHFAWTGDPTQGGDFAMIVLKRPLRGHPTLAFLPQPQTSEWEENKTLFDVGWCIQSHEEELSETLQGVSVFYHSVESCHQKYVDAGYRPLITPQMICAAGQDVNWSACIGHGESGGPLIIMGNSWEEDIAVGILSFGGPTGNVPDVYTRLSLYIEDLEYLLSVTSPAEEAPEIGEEQALMALKETSAANRQKLSGWNLSKPKCEWAGVTCSTSGRVTSLNLYDKGLKGTLPPQWSLLQSLEYMDLNKNLLTGSLPPQWSALGSLTVMDLRWNSLTRSLPPQWSALGSLMRMYLYANPVTGSLPPQWSALRSLTEMDLRWNSLTGSLPPQWSALENLALMFLYENSLTGSLPPQWSALESLKEMSLSGNSLAGSLPPQWSALESLTKIYLESNPGLRGTRLPGWPSGVDFRI